MLDNQRVMRKTFFKKIRDQFRDAGVIPYLCSFFVQFLFNECEGIREQKEGTAGSRWRSGTGSRAGIMGRDHGPYHVAKGNAKKSDEAGPNPTPTPQKKSRFGIRAGHHKPGYNPHTLPISHFCIFTSCTMIWQYGTAGLWTIGLMTLPVFSRLFRLRKTWSVRRRSLWWLRLSIGVRWCLTWRRA